MVVGGVWGWGGGPRWGLGLGGGALCGLGGGVRQWVAHTIRAILVCMDIVQATTQPAHDPMAHIVQVSQTADAIRAPLATVPATTSVLIIIITEPRQVVLASEPTTLMATAITDIHVQTIPIQIQTATTVIPVRTTRTTTPTTHVRKTPTAVALEAAVTPVVTAAEASAEAVVHPQADVDVIKLKGRYQTPYYSYSNNFCLQKPH